MRTRRIGCAAALLLVIVPGAAARSSARLNAIQQENARRGDAAWSAPYARVGSVEGYTSEAAVDPGGAVRLHVSMRPAGSYRVRLIRLGWYAGAGGRTLACIPSCTGSEAGAPQPLPAMNDNTGEVAADWPVTDTIAVPEHAVSGYYLVQLQVVGGSEDGRVQDVPLVVRAPAEQQSRVLVQVPINTWEGYNPWGGSCVYPRPVCERQAFYVSFDRPYAWESTGHNPLHWELPLVHFLERSGVDLAYQTDADTDADPTSLLRHRLVMTAGHGEYWTKGMFDAFDAARDAGTNLAFMGSNTDYWQIRYQLDRRRIVSFKNWDNDPEADPALKTVRFSDLRPPRYECELMGVQHLGGSYTHAVDDYTVSPAAARDPWFRGTGFKPGDTVSQIVSGERDDIPPGQEPGKACGHPMTILFSHAQTVQLQAAVSLRYLAASGARVFSTGSHDFAAGLDATTAPNRDDPRLERFMLNALDDLGRPAAPLLTVELAGRRVHVVVVPAADTRIRTTLVFRLSHGRRTLIRCRRGGCFDRPRKGRCRYAAVSLDRWGRSYPALSELLRVP
ncbi:MAG: hypothetical protein QOH73_1110 [Gaiellaceae bacterium]|nr:hypothetical protein [Gaiellaceae bacterium]